MLNNASSIRNMDTPPLSVKTSSVARDAQASTQYNNPPKQKKIPSVQIVVDRTHLCTKDVSPIKTQLLKQQRENKTSSTQQLQKDKPKCYNQTQLSQKKT